MSVYEELKRVYESFLISDANKVRWPFRKSYGISFPDVKKVEVVFVAIGPPPKPERYFYNPSEKDPLRSKLFALLAVHDKELRESLKEKSVMKKSIEVFLKKYYLTDADKEYVEKKRELLKAEINILSPRLIISLGRDAWAMLSKWIVEEDKYNFPKLLHLKIDDKKTEYIPTDFPR